MNEEELKEWKAQVETQLQNTSTQLDKVLEKLSDLNPLNLNPETPNDNQIQEIPTPPPPVDNPEIMEEGQAQEEQTKETTKKKSLLNRITEFL